MNTEYLKIKSQGEIELEAITLIGASSKRNDETKIGFFGSGLKYSIASMLRNKIDFKIFQGENEIKFDVVDKTFRSENYKAISVNNQETSMTTTMGGTDWDIPFAPFREIYSNALDEDEDVVLEKTYNVVGDTGYTTIYIENTREVSDFYNNFHEYFCDKNPNVLHSNKFISIFPKASTGNIRLFRKGILCFEENTKSLFSYNSPEFEINESRVLSNSYRAKYSIAKGYMLLDDKKIIKEYIDGLSGGNSGYYEHTLPYPSYDNFSESWFDVCKELKFVPAEAVMFCKPKQLEGRIILPKSLLIPLFRSFDKLDILGLSENSKDADFIIDEEPSEILTDKVIEAINLLSKTRYKSRLKNINIVYATFIDKDVLGQAIDGKIILSTKLETDDIPYIAKIIIEENEHLKSGFQDETRSFQNHLFKLFFDQLISETL